MASTSRSLPFLPLWTVDHYTQYNDDRSSIDNEDDPDDDDNNDINTIIVMMIMTINPYTTAPTASL